MHAFDRVLFRRSLALSLVACVLAFGVAVGTDEPYSSWSMRAARMSAFAPALSTLGAGVALAQARARGELRALEALGVSPWRVALGPMAAGWLLGSLAVALVLSPVADVSALFPKLGASSSWSWDGAALADAARGVRVMPGGELELGATQPVPGVHFVPDGMTAALALAPLAAVAPAWICAPLTLAVRVVGLALTLALTVLLLHAVAAGQISSGWLVVAALPLAVQAALGHAYGRTA